MSDQRQIEEAIRRPIMSRRKLLASLGIAGIAAAATSIPSCSSFVRQAEAAKLQVMAVSNIANLKAIGAAKLSTSDMALVEGYYTAGDGGGGKFYWDAASTQADNGGSVIIPSGHSGSGRWKRIVN
jgi:secreted PhoX family phosphatase